MASTAEQLRLIASGLDVGETPLNERFLSEHQVTLDQAMTLAEQLAIGAWIVAYALDHPQSAAGSVYFEAMVRSNL
jgi:hypothetical protein